MKNYLKKIPELFTRMRDRVARGMEPSQHWKILQQNGHNRAENLPVFAKMLVFYYVRVNPTSEGHKLAFGQNCQFFAVSIGSKSSKFCVSCRNYQTLILDPQVSLLFTSFHFKLFTHGYPVSRGRLLFMGACLLKNLSPSVIFLTLTVFY